MKTTHIKYILIVMLVGVIAMSSCRTPFHKCIWGDNEVITETRILDETDFTSIIHQGSFKVYVMLDTVDSLSVEAESNLHPYIYTKVEGNNLILKFRDNRCIRNNYPIRIFIHTTDLDRVSLEGSGLMDINRVVGTSFEADLTGSGDIELDVDVEYLDAEISGSGDIYANGTAVEADLKITGSGKVEALDLAMEKCYTLISGSGDMYVNVSDFLDVRITGSGDVHYLGNPVINTSITGSGSVYHY